MGDIVWKTGSASKFCAEFGDLRMTVEGVESPPGGARYLIHRKEGRDSPGALVCSGVEEKVRLAMEKAERVVLRRSGTPGRN